MAQSKRYASVKKVSLAGLSDEWDERCFAYVTPSVYADQQAIITGGINKKPADEQIDYQVQLVKDHFISGKIMAFDGESFSLVDMTAEDTAVSVAVCDHLYAAIMGFDLDPKDIRKAASESALQASEPKSTETSSSEASEAAPDPSN